MDTTTRNDVLRALKRAQPSKVRCTDAAGDVRVVAVPTRRTRWPFVVDAIDAAPWIRLELLNAKGEVLAVLDADQDDAPTAAPAAAPTAADAADRQLALLLKAQEQVLRFRDAEVTTLLRSVGDVMRAQSDALRSLQAVYTAQVQAAADLASMRAAARDDGGGADDLSAMLPQLLPLLGMLRPPPRIAPTPAPKAAPPPPPAPGSDA